MTFPLTIPWPRLGSLLDLALSPSTVSMSWKSSEGQVVTMSDGQRKRTPHSKEAVLSWLPEKMRFMFACLHRHPSLCFSQELLNLGDNFDRIRWGQGTDPRDKLQLSFEDRGAPEKRPDSVFSKERWQWKSPCHWTIGKQHCRGTLKTTTKPPQQNQNHSSSLRRKMQLEIYLPRQTSSTC